MRAAPLHDLGNVGIPDDIVRLEGNFTEEQREQMREHTSLGAYLLHGAENSVLQTAEQIALNHHERWDGLGYPQGLSHVEIPMAARIVAVADAFDAMTHPGQYKEPCSISGGPGRDPAREPVGSSTPKWWRPWSASTSGSRACSPSRPGRPSRTRSADRSTGGSLPAAPPDRVESPSKNQRGERHACRRDLLPRIRARTHPAAQRGAQPAHPGHPQLPLERCRFCPVYKDTDFSRRPLAHVLADIEAVAAWVETFAPEAVRRPSAQDASASPALSGRAVPRARPWTLVPRSLPGTGTARG